MLLYTGCLPLYISPPFAFLLSPLFFPSFSLLPHIALQTPIHTHTPSLSPSKHTHSHFLPLNTHTLSLSPSKHTHTHRQTAHPSYHAYLMQSCYCAVPASSCYTNRECVVWCGVVGREGEKEREKGDTKRRWAMGFRKRKEGGREKRSF